MEHMHKALKSLDWLEGTWRMRPQDDSNPIIKDFDYYEEISIKSLGQYMFNFTEQTFSNWDLKKPMHRERGFLKVDPKTNTIIFISALDTDLTMVEYGMISNNHMILNTMIGEIIKPYLIQTVRREFHFKDNCLEYMYYRASSTIPLRKKYFRTEFVKMSEEA